MVIMNQNDEEVTLYRDIFAEILDHYKWGIDVMKGSHIDLSYDFAVPGMTTSILDLKTHPQGASPQRVETPDKV